MPSKRIGPLSSRLILVLGGILLAAGLVLLANVQIYDPGDYEVSVRLENDLHQTVIVDDGVIGERQRLRPGGSYSVYAMLDGSDQQYRVLDVHHHVLGCMPMTLRRAPTGPNPTITITSQLRRCR